MSRIGFSEILLVLILALVLFGGGKISGIGKALGQSIREFKKEIGSDEEKKDEDKKEKDPKDSESKA